MKDEYSPRDLKFQKVKKIYRSQLAGPTLKEMEYNKRMEELLL
jgi:hypothetical protein